MTLGISWKPLFEDWNGAVDNVDISIMDGVQAVVSRFEPKAQPMFGFPHDPAYERIVQFIDLVFGQYKIVKVKIGANASVKNPVTNFLIARSGLSRCLDGENRYQKAKGESKSKMVLCFFHHDPD